MKRIVFCIVFAAIFGSASIADEKYINSKLGFSFTPFPEWTQEIKEKDDSVQIDMYSEDMNYFVTLSAGRMGTGETFENVISEVKGGEGYILVEEKTTGDNIYDAKITCLFNDIECTMLSRAYVKGNNKIKISAWSPTPTMEKNRQNFENAIARLKFVKEYLADSFSGKDKGGEGWGNETLGWFIDGGAYTTGIKEKFAFSLRGDPGWKDYTFKAKFKNGKDGGLMVRAKDKDNAMAFLIKPEAKKVMFKLRKDGKWGEVLDEAGLEPTTSQIIDVQVEAEGNQYTAFINGKELLSVKDETFSAGKIGLYLYAPIKGQYFDDVAVMGSE